MSRMILRNHFSFIIDSNYCNDNYSKQAVRNERCCVKICLKTLVNNHRAPSGIWPELVQFSIFKLEHTINF